MKRLLSAIMAFVLIISAIYVFPTSAHADTDIVYQTSYGEQLGEEKDSLSRYLYNQMYEYYVYQDGDEGNTDNRYTGMAKPLVNDGKIFIDKKIVAERRFASMDELKSYNWGASEEFKFLEDCIRDALDAFAQDYPEVFWIKGMEMSVQIMSDISVEDDGSVGASMMFAVTLKPQKYQTGFEGYINTFNDSVFSAVETISRRYGITENSSEEVKAKAIHDYIASEVEYYYAVVGNTSHKDYNYAHTPIPVFMQSSSWADMVVCEGYSKAYKILCDRFGVDSAILVGTSINPFGHKEIHMWNATKVKNKWYAVDVAWDDQDGTIWTLYFLCGTKSAGFYALYENDHEVFGRFSDYERSKVFAVPKIELYRYSMVEETSTTKNTQQPTVEAGTTQSGETGTTQTGGTGNLPTGNTSGTETTTAPKETTQRVVEETPVKTLPSETPTTHTQVTKVEYVWKMTGLTNKTYTGKAITQKIKLTYGKTVLKEGKDYKISYKNNVNAGTAQMIVQALGKFASATPSTYKYTFKIDKASIASSKANKIKTQKYKKGKAIKPKVTIKINGKTLKKNKDYTVKYKNNKKKGTAKIIVTGKGNYKGSKTIKFKIK